VNVETVMRDLDAVTRERNELAAELAGLKSQLAEAAAKEAAALVSASPATDVKVAVPEAPTVTEAESLELPFPVDPAANGQILEYSAECPQRLGEVRGIGAAFETQLFSAGIGSYWQLSQLTDERLSEVLELNHEARAAFDFSAVKAEALKRAEETESLGRKWSGEAPDDLTMIDDLTEAFQRKLADAGICTFATLAQSSPELLARICPSVSARPVDYSVWIDQARLLAEASAA
jgi:predicted flap endonuclease-1-like 5' DNA nuclease